MLDETSERWCSKGKRTFVEALERGTASAEYLREADERFARIHSPEPVNRLIQESRRRMKVG